jgi:hypothetical protein
MELLGNYESSITSFYYQELLALLNTAVSAGDLAGGSAFDQTSLSNLESQAQSFANLPTASAHSRVTDDTFNYPLSLLQARLNALQSEVDRFTTISGRLLQILVNETLLIDQLLAADSLSQWVVSKPKLIDSWSQSWDFSISLGPQYQAAALTNPANSVIYDNQLTIRSVFDTNSGNLSSGLAPFATTRTFTVKNLIWSLTSDSNIQEIYGPDATWAQLDVISDEPAIDFSALPTAQVILPAGINSTSDLIFTGQVPGGAIPTYVRYLFYPRSNYISANVTNAISTGLSLYNIDPNIVNIISSDGSTSYQLNVDFTANNNGTIIPIRIGSNIPVVIYFTEYWPAYQCSLDQLNWSPIIMIDPNRIYPDDATSYIPVDIQTTSSATLFPIMDESGLSNGLYFQLPGTLSMEYTILVNTPAGMISGPSATLEVDIDQPSFMTCLSIAPFSALPMTLTNVQIEGLTSNTLNTVWNGTYILEQPIEISFDRQVVSKVFLTLAQNNYTIKEYQSESTDALRRNIMNSIESSLPISISNSSPVVPVVFRGYQYEWGLEDLVGLDIGLSIPGVFVQGPYTITGCPDVVRFDADLAGTVSVYIVYYAYSSTGTLLDYSDNGFAITPGSAIVFPFTGGTVRADITSVQIGLRFVLNSVDAMVSRYLLQATLN